MTGHAREEEEIYGKEQSVVFCVREGEREKARERERWEGGRGGMGGGGGRKGER